MPLSKLSQDYNNISYTVVDNAFITQYLPDAPVRCVDVYLFGLYLTTCDQNNNTIEMMSRALNLKEDDIINAYMYWEQLGIVHLLNNTPIEVIYLPLKGNQTLLKKIKPSKYTSFNKQMQNVLTSRMITPNEYNQYYMFLESTMFDPNALVAVAKYCTDIKGCDINYSYILTVARNLSSAGFITLEQVETKLTRQSRNNDDIVGVFKSLNIKRDIEYYDRQLLEKWIADLGFTLEVVNFVAKTIKKGGMDALDNRLNDYYKLGKMSTIEIEDYIASKDNLYSLAKDVNKILGLYYQSLDYIIEQYTVKWLEMGFTSDTLMLIAKYCFSNNIRNLDGMNTAVEKFYKKGLVGLNAIVQHLEQLLDKDNQIKQLLTNMGVLRNVSNTDRANFNTWTNDWNIDFALIAYASTKCGASYNPMQSLSRICSTIKTNHLTTTAQIDEIKNTYAPTQSPKQSTLNNFPSRNYTKEELSTLFSDIDKD